MGRRQWNPTDEERQAFVERKEAERERLHEQLKQQVKRIQSSEEFVAWLKVASKFHRYSLNNQILIWWQRPDATRCMGYTDWPKVNRYVRKGETGIRIFAPLIKKQEETDERVLVGFRVVSTFDISQTDGEELPRFDVPQLDGEGDEALYAAIVSWLESEGVTVTTEDRHPEGASRSYLGYYMPSKQLIYVKPNSGLQMLKTLIHEAGHSCDPEVMQAPPEEQETVAEATAYSVCAAFGLDVGSYSFRYIAAWCKQEDGAEVLERVMQRTARAVKCIVAGAAALLERAEVTR